MKIGRITAKELRSSLLSSEEIALLDLREAGAFGQAHILLAVNLPLSRLELEIRRLVPRRGTRLALCDGNDGLAARAATVLSEAGYGDISVLDGGAQAWGAAGYELFSGINVPSKAFGEVVEQRYGTPHMACEDLKARLDRGDDLVILDSRPFDEYQVMNIPGGIDLPGAELVYRVRELAPDPETLVVVNCAGRTRSIIGCQSLINAATPNRVVALENGTMGWHLAGFELETGARRTVPEVSDGTMAWAKQAAAQVAARFAVKRVDAATLETWRSEREERSLYVLDVRGPDEYEAGHLADAQPAPGGQLVQSTDAYLAVRQARLVLVDDSEVRATMTASWLNQMGFPDVYVLSGGLDGHELVAGPYRPERPEVSTPAVPLVPPDELSAAGDDLTVVDVGNSLKFRAGHLPGAWWAIRSRLADCVASLPATGRYVVTSASGELAKLAAADLSHLVAGEVRALAGGTEAWQRAGLPLEPGLERTTTACDDVYERPYDQERDVEAAMQSYLTWEVGLVEQLECDGTLSFPLFPDS